MSQRRLPLLRTEDAPQEARAALLADTLAGSVPVRLELPGQVIVVGDTANGDAALAWAAQLGTALEEGGAGMMTSWVLGRDVLSAPQRSLFKPSASLQLVGHALLVAGQLPDELARPRGLTIVTGPLALPACRGRLNVLVCADAAVLRWPETLRAMRGSFELELAGDGLFSAAALAQALIERWR